MPKTNKKKIMLLCEEINKKQGDGAIYTIDDANADLKISRWSTGIADLDAVIGGGMPEGRTVEIYGAEGAGKTTLAYHLCAMHDICLYIPAEGTMDVGRAELMGNRKGQMFIYRGKCGEDMLNKSLQMAKLGIPIVCIDSVPSVIPKNDLDKVHKSANKDTIEEQCIGGTARLMEKYIPVLEETIENTGTTLILVNQIRDRLNALPFGETTRTPGGHRLLHSYSLRLAVARKAWVDIPNYNPQLSAEKERIGLIMKIKVVKSKVCNPLGECEVPLLFDRGFTTFEALPAQRKEIMEEKKEYYKTLAKQAKEEAKKAELDEWEGVEG